MNSFFKKMILAAVAPLSGRLVSNLDQVEQWLRIASLVVGLGVGVISLVIAAIQLYRILKDKYQRRKIRIHLPTLIAIAGVLVFAGGCSSVPKAQRGGRASHGVSPRGTLTFSSLEQGENPSQPTTQAMKEEITREYQPAAPSGDVLAEFFRAIDSPEKIHYRDASGQKRVFTNSTRLPASEVSRQLNLSEGGNQRPLLKETIKRETQTSLGAAQKDEGRTLGVKMDALRPVMLAGVLMLIAAGALFYFGHYLAGGISAAIGVAMLVLFVTLPQYGIWIMGIGLVGATILIALVFLAYYKGNHHALQDALSLLQPQTDKANESLNKGP